MPAPLTDERDVPEPSTAPRAPEDALLVVDGLSVVYGGAVQALREVSLWVPRNGVVAVLGGNGAGKTTLLRAVSGALGGVGGAVTAGTIRFDGRPIERLGAAGIVRAGVVQVPEGRRVFRDLTVADNLRAGALPVADRAARRESLERVFELFPVLAERRTQRAGLLSGGEQQMLAMGRALMAGPRLLLLDEPSLGLAPQLVERIGGIVTRISAQGTPVLLIEQNAAMGLRVADTAFVLEVGRVTAAGPAAELAGTERVRERYLGVAASAAPVQPAEAPAAPTAQRLRVDGLTVRFGGLTALSEVSFEVAPGAVHALIGPNGAGKSTCINVLGGAYRATAGSVHYGEHRLTALPPHRIAALGVARTFQNLALSPEATVTENLLAGRHRLMRAGVLATGLRLPAARREEREHRAAVERVAELLGIAPLLGRAVHGLSYGDRKRVELGRALCAEPTLLLLDEPVAGMNAEESAAMAAAIGTARRELGVSVLLVEHDMAFVMGLAERVTVLDFGRRIADGTPDEVRADPEVLRAYLGAEPA